MLQYHSQITRSKASLESSGFLSWFCKLALFDTVITSQNVIIFFERTKPNKAINGQDSTQIKGLSLESSDLPEHYFFSLPA